MTGTGGHLSVEKSGLGFRSGLERLCAGLLGAVALPVDRGMATRIRTAAGLLTHPAAVGSDLTGAVELLAGAGARLVALFGPEHGVRGDAPDGRAVAGGIDSLSGLPTYSLYRGSGTGAQSPLVEMFRGLEVLLVDLQDVGARFYTYASTVSLCMEAAAAAEVPLVILDRPNPIGREIEGPRLRSEFASFIGLHPLPIRHGCTLGELALLFHRAFGVGAEPTVVPFGPEPPTTRFGLDSHWVPPSPNMPTRLTALVYPGTALLEGTNVSEGRGTAKPFEWIGAPWVEPVRLVERLTEFQIPAVAFRPVHFIPSASKWAGETCGGVQIHVLIEDRFRPVMTGVALLAALGDLWPKQFAWRENEGRFAIDRLAGTDALRLAIAAGIAPMEIAAGWREEEAAFRALREDHLA